MYEQSAGALRVQLDGGCVLISVVGEFDLLLHASFVEAAELGGGEVVVDLSETTYLDSSGLRALVIGNRDALERGATLRIDRASSAARLSLEITGLVEAMGLSSGSDGSEDTVEESAEHV